VLKSTIFDKIKKFMIAIIAAILCGIWGYKVLEQKGYNTPIIGACLGGLLGIFGVLICYLFFNED